MDSDKTTPISFKPRDGSAIKPKPKGTVERDTTAALRELSQAAKSAKQTTTDTMTASRGISVGWVAIIALVVGLATSLVVPLRYACTATISLTGEAAAEFTPGYRDKLWAHAGNAFNDTGNLSARPNWIVESTNADQLRIVLVTTDTDQGKEKIKEIANTFLEQIANEKERLRTTPDEAERALSEYVAALKARLEDAQSRIEEDIRTNSSDDPRFARDEMLNRWREMSREFTDVRSRLAAARETVDELEQSPPPTHGIVPSHVRREALAEDDALKQDLSELEVQLSATKAQMLAVWKETKGRLDELQSAALTAKQLTDGQTNHRNRDQTGLRIASFVAEATRYEDDLTKFNNAWSDEFNRLEAMSPDAHSAKILDLYEDIRSELSEFLFQATERLASLRTYTQTMGERLSDNARNHVLYSEVTRIFQTLQNAHHRFEFSAGGIEANSNFRLDAALRSARGLRRRSVARIRAIDERLEKHAHEQAIERQRQALANARNNVKQVRNQANSKVNEIISLQEELNVKNRLSEEFLTAVLRAEYASSLADLTQQDLALTEEKLDHLRSIRLASVDNVQLELASITASSRPINMNDPIKLALFAAIATFVTIFGAQWYLGKSG